METKMASQKARATAEPGSDSVTIATTSGYNNLSASSKCLVEPRSGKMILHLHCSSVNVM